MQTARNALELGVVLSAVLASLVASAPVSVHGAEHEPGHAHTKAQQHDGSVVMTKDHHFEVVFDGNMVKVYGYDASQNPIPLKGVSGSATLRTEASGGGDKADLELHSGDTGDYLEAHLDGLSKQAAGKAKIAFELSGLSSGGTTTFVATYAPSGHEDEGHGQHHH